MTAKQFFTQEWGTGFAKATLSEKNGLLEMSMEDIYSTMEKYVELRLSNQGSNRYAIEHLVNGIYQVVDRIDGTVHHRGTKRDCEIYLNGA